MSLFKSVFKSVFKRKDVNIFLTFAFLPVLVPLLSGFMEGMSSEYTGNFLSFLESAVSTQYRFVLPILLFSLVVSSVFKDEIDSGIMFLYKDINRKKIFKIIDKDHYQQMLFGVLLLHRWREKIVLGIVVDHGLGKDLIIFMTFTGCQFFFHKGSNLIHV